MKNQEIVLTGDRPTGPLHLGHYVGSLKERTILQNTHTQYVMIADTQALTDNFETPEKVRQNVLELVLDYLSVGLDPEKSIIFIQSCIPEIAELTVFFLNLVTINRLKRNPTVKTEIAQKKYGEDVTAGFLMYPVSQTADIAIVRANVVPVGEDQLPMIEQANEIVHRFNTIYKQDVFPKMHALTRSTTGRLPGIDGKAKMSKSLSNAIFLKDDADTVTQKVMKMYTDPNHIHVSDPGNVKGNTVFTYLAIFDPEKEEVEKLKEHYTRGGLGDVTIKKRLIEVINTFLNPIREKRKEYEKNIDFVKQLLHKGNIATKKEAEKTMKLVRSVMHLDYTK
jgi:tryptophanyl-tRNA synthetase